MGIGFIPSLVLYGRTPCGPTEGFVMIYTIPEKIINVTTNKPDNKSYEILESTNV
ncbi:MAG: hypothetical protein PVI26_09095 [Chitinispirillia bacterium]